MFPAKGPKKPATVITVKMNVLLPAGNAVYGGGTFLGRCSSSGEDLEEGTSVFSESSEAAGEVFDDAVVWGATCLAAWSWDSGAILMSFAVS